MPALGSLESNREVCSLSQKHWNASAIRKRDVAFRFQYTHPKPDRASQPQFTPQSGSQSPKPRECALDAQL